MKKFAGQPRTTVDTIVGPRALAVEAGQRWFEGEGRGYTREFVPADDETECDTCSTVKPLTAFPTFSVPRKDGRTRADTCRECRDTIRDTRRAKKEAEAAAAFRSERARKAAAARWAKARETVAA